MKSRPRRVVIGRITRAHGLRGEIRVEVITDHPDRFAPLSEVWLTREGEVIGHFFIEGWRPLGKAVGLKLRGLDTPEAVADYRGALIKAESLPADNLPDDTFYTFDLIGLDVLTEEGERLGEVLRVDSFPASDVLIVRRGGAEMMIPLVAEVIRSVDLDGGVITIGVLPGLLDL